MSSTPRTRTLLAAATAVAALLPPVLQASAEHRVEQALARCGPDEGGCGALGRIDVDIAGLRLFDITRRVRSKQIRAQRVDVRPTPSGVDVHVTGLTVESAPPGASGSNASPADSDPRPLPGASPAPPLRLQNHGIPIRMVAPGTISLAVGPATVELTDPQLEVDRNGRVTAYAGLAVTHPRGSARSLVPLEVEPIHGMSTWRVDGLVSIAHGPGLELDAEVGRDRIVGRLAGAQTGGLSFAGQRAGGTVRIQADAFQLASIGTLARQAVGSGEVDVRQAVLDGDLEIRRGAHGSDTMSAHMDALQLRGGLVRHARLAGEDVELGTLTLAGDLERSAEAVRGQMTAEHDGVGLHVFGELTQAHISVHLEIATTSCQSALDSIPDGLTGILAGMRVDGSVSGTLDLEAEFAAIAAHQEVLERTPSEAPPAPGTFELDFTPLESCAVVADPAAVDLQALHGPYRHRFVDADGRARSRVMAPGAAGFVTLRSVPLLAAAFTTLEDARYFRHDGFDREHIESAVWHNLARGEISRGASTITQQAARNLFLGVDRTIARKLQEAVLADRLERELDKRRVLELYLNIIELGPGVHGVEEAAQYHFGKSADQLSPAQAVHIAKLAPAPNTYSERWRAGSVDAAWRGDIHYQLKRLRYHHVINSEQLKRELRSDLNLLDRMADEPILDAGE